MTTTLESLSPNEKSRLSRLHANGWTYSQIAERTGYSRYLVIKHIKGIKRTARSAAGANAKPAPVVERVAKMRRCLMCSKRFKSAWAGERVCRACRTSRRWRNGE